MHYVSLYFYLFQNLLRSKCLPVAFCACVYAICGMCVRCTLSIIYFSYLKLHRKIQKMRIYKQQALFQRILSILPLNCFSFHSSSLHFTYFLYVLFFRERERNSRFTFTYSQFSIYCMLFLQLLCIFHVFFHPCMIFARTTRQKRSSKPRKPENKIYEKNKWHFICNTVFSVYRQ